MTTEAWLQSGLTEVLLPSGYRVRGRMPTVARLVQRGVFPAHLLEVAVKLADPSWLQEAEDVDDRLDKAREYLNVLVAAFPQDVWDDEAGWERITEPVSLDNLDDDDIDAIEHVVMRLWTPEHATAIAELALGIRDDADVDDEGLPDWATFRRERRSREAGDDGSEVGTAAEPDAGTDGAGDGTGTRRGAGSQADDRGDAGDDAGLEAPAGGEPAGPAAAGGDALRDRSGPREVVAA